MDELFTPEGPTWVKPCQSCGREVARWRGEGDVSCECGAWYNAGGQRLRDDWMGNPAWTTRSTTSRASSGSR